MFALIKREFVDNIVLFVMAIMPGAMISVLIIQTVVRRSMVDAPIGIPESMYEVFWGYLLVGAFVTVACGAVQMHGDKNEKISTFLSTLATTRKHIMAAKLIFGGIVILILSVPVVVTDIALLRVFSRLAPIETSVLIKPFVTIFSVFVCCYAIGLQSGWRTSKIMSLLSSIALAAVMILVVVIKGFSVESVLILLLFSVASLICTWQKFLNARL